MFTGPQIVRDGLVLYLDSTNSKSYPGSGNTWFDISGNSNHGTLVDFTGPGSTTTSGFNTTTKYMMFDRHIGTSDGTQNNRVTVPTSTSLQQCLSQNGVTIEIWLRMDTYYCTALTRWAGPWEIYYCTSLVHRTIGTNGSDGNSGYSYTNKLGTFHQIVGTHNGSSRRLYVNGESVLSDTNVVSNQDFSAGLGIGAYFNGTYAFFGTMPVYKIYNRALSQEEISQNFNALKGRFRI
jgi:hypothetical protein